jgi:hypothetical protein
MSRHDAHLLRRQLALHHMKVSPADAAGVNSNQNFTFAWLRNGKLAQLEGVALDRVGMLEHTAFHRS